jgi:hypothetical protein
MRVILTFSEVETGNDICRKVLERLQSMHSCFKDSKVSRSPLRELGKIAQTMPELVKIDDDQQLVIISIPEETTIQLLGSVDEFYMDLLDLVPMVVSFLRLLIAANNRYFDRTKVIGDKLKKMVMKKAD